ncbi:MAG: hypothetical protein RIS35_1088 [Pseudomonadota bacterium]
MTLARAMREPLDIVYCFDARYVPYAAVSIYSLCLSARSPLRIHCVVPPDEVRDRGFADRMRDWFGVAIRFHDAPDLRIVDWQVARHISWGTYLRLMIPDLLTERRAVYLDADTLVLGDLEDLHQTPLDGCPVGGVVDPVGGRTTRMPRRDGDPYLNAGVLVMDLDQMRQGRLLEACTAIREQYGERLTWADQCVINKYAEGRKRVFDERWNRQVFANKISREDWARVSTPIESSVLHFVGSTKPWDSWCDPVISEFWWSYARKVGLEGLAPTKASRAAHYQQLAAALDSKGDFEAASRVKGELIERLIRYAKRKVD